MALKRTANGRQSCGKVGRVEEEKHKSVLDAGAEGKHKHTHTHTGEVGKAGHTQLDGAECWAVPEVMFMEGGGTGHREKRNHAHTLSTAIPIFVRT